MADHALPDCPHGMPNRAACLTCMEDGAVVAPARWEKVGGPFPARYDGACPCGAAIRVGDLVQRWDRGDEATVYTERGCRP